MKRIYTKNNYLIIEWSGSAPLMRPKKNIFFFRSNSNIDQYFIKDSFLNIPVSLEVVLWTDFVKEDGTPFSTIIEFNDWITANTGNFNSGSGPTPDPEASENIPKVLSLSLSDIGATSWNDDIKTLLAQYINSLGLDIKSAELYFFEVEGDDGIPGSSDVVTDVSISMTTNSELSLSTTSANGQTEVTIIPLNPLEENGW